MTRITITSAEDASAIEGWFDYEKSDKFEQGKEWDGHNWIGLVTRSEFIDETLLRTVGGRWVINHDASRYNDGPDSYRFAADEEARDWLLRQGDKYLDVIAQYWPETPDERGPGRPEIGGRVTVAIGEDRLARVDSYAVERGMTRAEAMRGLIDAALARA